MKADIRARLESAAPLIGAYLLLATLYAWLGAGGSTGTTSASPADTNPPPN